jgi:[ribosomal protein S18]-alanine N-acetyltransferase
LTSHSIHVRRLGYSDLPQVIAIERRSFPTPWSLAMFVLELSKPSGVCLAAVRHDGPEPYAGDGASSGGRRGRDHLLGYLVCSRYDDVWHLMNIAVDPVVRRRGLGSKLLKAMLERAGQDSTYTLEVRTSNTSAIALYERYGFRSAGTRPRYYQDTGEDAMIMWRTTDAQSSTLAGGSASK